MSRSEYCAINNLDDNLTNFRSAHTDAEKALDAALKMVRNKDEEIDLEDLEEILTDIETAHCSIEHEIAEYDDAITNAEEVARDALAEATDSGREDGETTGRDDAEEEFNKDVAAQLPALLDDRVNEVLGLLSKHGGREGWASDLQLDQPALYHQIMSELEATREDYEITF